MALDLSIPGSGHYRLSHLVLDVNGTLTQDGVLIPGVAERLEQIHVLLTIHLLSADTYGRLGDVSRQLGVSAKRLQPDQPEQEQKAAYIRALNRESVVAIGNGANDATMLAEAAIGIAVLGPEGLAVAAINSADIVVGSILAALDLLLYPKRLVASLRK